MEFLLYLALVPTLAFAAQWIAWRTRLPGILLLLLIGVALGRLISPDTLLAELTNGDEALAGPRLLFPFVSLAVAVIMFEGGLSLKLDELRESGAAAFRLCTIGAIVTVIGATLAAQQCLGFEWRLATLQGAILLVTGPTVIGPLLRQVKPSVRVSNTLKWEGIVIDPVGAVAAVLVFEVVLLRGVEATLVEGVLLLAKTTTIGVLSGVLVGMGLTYSIRRFLIPDNLHGGAAFAVTLLLYAVTDHFAHESGLIAVTTFGLWLTNQHDFDKEHIVEFFEHLRTISIGCLFILLSSRVELAQIREVGLPAVGLILLLVLLVRPISVFLALIGSKLDYRERTFVAAMAPRGIVAAAVSSIFALRIEQSAALNVPDSQQLAIVTFIVIIGTVTIYGLLAQPLANFLGLSESTDHGVLVAGADQWVVQFALELQRAGCRVVLVDTNFSKITNAKLAGLEAVCASILNENARSELPLSGIGQMFAMTPNDEVNSLALREYQGVFGRANTYQLTFKSETRRAMTKTSMARELFGEDLTHRRISQLVASGMEFKATRLTEEFNYEDFQKYYAGARVLAVIEKDEPLQIATVDDPLIPAVDQTVVALIREPESNGNGSNGNGD